MTLQQSGCQSSPSHHATDKFINVSPTKVHPHSLHTISAPTRFSPIPRMKVVQHKNGGPVTNNRTVNPNSDGTNPWYTAAVPVSGQEIGQSGGGGRSPLEGGKPTEPISPAHTRIFNSSSASPQDLSHSRLYQPSPPKGMGGRDEGAERERRKFNCCRQVMDILEKQEKKLKNTFNHGEGGENSVKVRSNHTVTELTGVLRDLGAKVDENEIQEAFRGAGDASGGITFSQLSAISTDTVYPGSNNGHADFFDVPKRDGKRVGVGPGAKHNGYVRERSEHLSLTNETREQHASKTRGRVITPMHPRLLSTSQHISAHLSTSQHISAHLSTSQHISAHLSTSQHISAHLSTSQHISAHLSTSQHISTHLSTSQHISTHLNTSQHISTHLNTSQHISLTHSTCTHSRLVTPTHPPLPPSLALTLASLSGIMEVSWSIICGQVLGRS